MLGTKQGVNKCLIDNERTYPNQVLDGDLVTHALNLILKTTCNIVTFTSKG